MAVVRLTKKPSKFKFEGVVVGLRKPTTDEMRDITKLRADYMKTVRAELIEEKRDQLGLNPEGDGELLMQLESHVSALLCCDPENADNPWFAKDAAEQKALAVQGIEKDRADEVPAAFHHIAFQVFSVVGLSDRERDFTTESEDETTVPQEDDENKAPLESASTTTATSTTEPTTTSSSESKSPTSQDTSTLTQ